MNFKNAEKHNGQLWFLLWMRKDSDLSALMLLRRENLLFLELLANYKSCCCAYALWLWLCFIHTLTHANLDLFNLLSVHPVHQKVKYRLLFAKEDLWKILSSSFVGILSYFHLTLGHLLYPSSPPWCNLNHGKCSLETKRKKKYQKAHWV